MIKRKPLGSDTICLKKRIIKIVAFSLIILVALVAVKYCSIIIEYKNVLSNTENCDWRITQRPFYNTKRRIKFCIDGTEFYELNLWWKSISGEIAVTITDDKEKVCFDKKASHMNGKYPIHLEEGTYMLEVNISNFTGAAILDYGEALYINEFPNENFNIIASNPARGFHWEYILYIPSEVKVNRLLVIPNNTGYISDNIDVHKEKAKGLIIAKSDFADKLGTPLLVPIFPRPKSNEELYTHALDRGTILTDIEELKRLDLQLIFMIHDAKRELFNKGIAICNKIFMSGFSASGDFVDRFIFLHPDMVMAAVTGGCENIIPFEQINSENLPYPIGIYDYKNITGNKFDPNKIAEVYRYIYKGSEDEGGWQIINENGEKTVYTGKAYYEKYQLPKMLERLQHYDAPIYTSGNVTNEKQEYILFKAYNGKILLDRFLLIKDLYSELKMDRSQFVIYDGVDHNVTEEIQEDELMFFQTITKNR